ncbi:hypothetical protein PTB13_13115, partial [Bacillus sp. MHSD17]|nr:hypothetical protein [Bacillus sp. MHSD17]
RTFVFLRPLGLRLKNHSFSFFFYFEYSYTHLKKQFIMKGGKREKERERDVTAFYILDYGWDCSNLGFVTRDALTGHCNDF